MLRKLPNYTRLGNSLAIFHLRIKIILNLLLIYFKLDYDSIQLFECSQKQS